MPWKPGDPPTPAMMARLMATMRAENAAMARQVTMGWLVVAGAFFAVFALVTLLAFVLA